MSSPRPSASPGTTSSPSPCIVGEEPAAVILAIDREDGTPFGGDDQELLGVLATFAAIAVRTSRSLARELARAEALARLRQTQTDAEARRETLARVVETQERERRRLAQDLHDRTAGGLTSVLFALRRLERELADDGQRAQLREAREGVSSAIEDVRDLIADLRPKVLDDFGLGPALERLCETVARRSGLAVRAGAGREPRPVARPTSRPRSTGSSRRRSSNVVRHADATTISVSAAILDDRLVVTVEDDGKGFVRGQRRARRRGHGRASAHGRRAASISRARPVAVRGFASRCTIAAA